MNERGQERKIGERFTISGKEVVVISYRGCRDCVLFDSLECSEYRLITGPCVDVARMDQTTVAFMDLEDAKKKGLIE